MKSTLSSLPTFYLSLFTIPKVVAARLESIQRNFIWGSLEWCFKYPLMAWENVCSPIEVDGLGTRYVVSFNQALLRKWLWRIWRYGHEVNHFWQRVISTKYGEGQGGWSTKVCKRAHGCAYGVVFKRESFSKHLSFLVGDGTRIRFWHDQCSQRRFRQAPRRSGKARRCKSASRSLRRGAFSEASTFVD